jgi:phosphatidylglycerophosphate synthase
VRRAADLCTWFRIALAPLFAWTVAEAHAAPSPWPLAIFAAAALSDFADGRLARAGGRVAPGGRLFDHGADALFLFPALIVLAAFGRVPTLLPVAATVAFTLYVADGWRRRGAPGPIELVPSQVGAFAGVLNYAVSGLAAGTLWMGPSVLDPVTRLTALAVALVNAWAIVERGARQRRLAVATRHSGAESS